MTLTIYGETPSKKNSRINTRSGRSFPSKRYTEWHDDAVTQILRQWDCRNKPIEKCNISLVFYHGDLRKRDSDNGTSSIFDLLKDVGVIRDDNWMNIPSHHVGNDYDKKNPRCEIVIEVLPKE